MTLQQESQLSSSAPSSPFLLATYDYTRNPHLLHTKSYNFVDSTGRVVLLRGVNLSGASKAPVGRLSHLELVHEGEGGISSSGSRSRSPTTEADEATRIQREEERVSFVNRPLNLDDGSADVHLARLRGWGFNMLRFPFTWEALEHAGPGIYDYEYMDYIVSVLCKCREYGFRVYMDPHQDTWSRFSGGSGAPFWTLQACGIDIHNITATQAAIVHSEYFPPPTASFLVSGNPSSPRPEPEKLPAMVWSTNYGRLLSQTIFTLFFAGRDFAPKCIIDGVNIQDYLQSHYIEACGKLSDRIATYDNGSLLDTCVIGWDSMNEPFEGLIGWPDLNKNPDKQGSTLKKGTYPTPAQSMRLGMGRKELVENWSFGSMGPKREGSIEIDPRGKKVWIDAYPVSSFDDDDQNKDEDGIVRERPDGYHPHFHWKRDTTSWRLGTCIWALHGVWDLATGYILRPEYFMYHPQTGLEVEFLTDYWRPHFVEYTKRVKRGHQGAIMFVQPPVFAVPPKFNGDSEDEPGVSQVREEGEEDEGLRILNNRAAYSPHYYDGLTLITRHWNWFNADALGLLRGKYRSPLQAVKIGEGAIRRSLREQLAYLQADVPGSFVYERGKAKVPGSGSTSLSTFAPGSPSTSRVELEGQYPTIIGEIGTPFDMDGKKSYGWGPGGKGKGDYSNQEKALDASLQACDVWLDGWKRGWGDADGGRLYSDGERMGIARKERETGRPGESLNWTVWTYVPDDHSHDWGDGWNMEDLSLFSVDDLPEDDGDDDGEDIYDYAEEDQDGVPYKLSGDLEEDEDVLNSRAVLLRNATGGNSRPQLRPSLTDGLHGKSPMKAEVRTKRKITRNQPSKNLPMEAAMSSFSLATLGGVAASASSSSLSLGESTRRDKVRVRKVINENAVRAASRASSFASTTGSVSKNTNAKKFLSLERSRHAYYGIAGYHPNPYVFLTAGARGVRAFARPWPVKVVGRAVDVRFDIGKGSFRMVVWVEEGDGVQEVQGEVLGERPATEVFVPLVHYAHANLVEDVKRRGMGEAWQRYEYVAGGNQVHEDDNNEEDKDSGATVVGNYNHQQEQGDGRTNIIQEVVDPIVLNQNQRRSPSPTSSSSTNSIATYSLPKTAPLLVDPGSSSYSDSPSRDEPEPNPLVDIDVTISGGTYSVRGQTLYWLYDVPKPGSGIKRKEYVLEMKRRGGVLEFPVKRRGGNKKGVENGMTSVISVCDKLCPEEGCVVV